MEVKSEVEKKEWSAPDFVLTINFREGEIL
jgi:hypothetical protein